MNVLNVMENLKNFLKKNSPQILTIFGISGMVTSTILAVKATPKAIDLIEEKINIKENELNLKQKISVSWKCYIPSIISCGLGTACLISANSVNFRRNTALAAAYSISETALQEYKNKIVETLGENKATQIKDEIAKDKIDKNPINEKNIIITNNGDIRCYDSLCNRYFTSNIESLKSVQNSLNDRLIHEDFISLNDFYYEVGLPSCDLGKDLGWKLDRGLLELDFSAQLDNTGTPCLVVSFNISPKQDYDMWS